MSSLEKLGLTQPQSETTIKRNNLTRAWNNNKNNNNNRTTYNSLIESTTMRILIEQNNNQTFIIGLDKL
jgi:hypothetical protein